MVPRMNELNMRMLMRVVMVQSVTSPQAVADRTNGIPFAFAIPYSVYQGDNSWH